MSQPNLPLVVQRYPVLRQVYEVLDRTTLYTHHRGNFNAALQVAEDEYRRSHPLGGTRLAAALTSRGIVRTLQGNCSAALNDLNEAVILARTDLPLQLLAFLYVYQATRTQYTFFPDIGPAAAKDIERRFDNVDALQNWQIQTRYLSPAYALDPLLGIESQVLKLYQSIITFPHPHPAGDPALQASLNALLSVFDTGYHNLAIQHPDPSVLAHLRLLRAKALHRSHRKYEAMQDVAIAGQLCRQVNDLVGLANIELTLGDWLVAPLSSPEVWNSSLSEGTYDTSLHWQLEEAETHVDTEGVGEARTRYHAALDMFRSVNMSRGIAAARSRLGYLAVLEGMRHISFESYFEVAREQIEFSTRPSSDAGDIMAFQLGQAQLALCAVGQGEIPEQRERAASIGQWGRGQGSFGFALGIGLFFGRMGWRWVNRIGDYERALACFRLSEELFKSLGASLSHIHSITDQLKAYQMLGDFPSCSRMSERALDECLGVRNQEPQLATDTAQLARWISIQMLGLATSRANPRLIENVRSYIHTTRGMQASLPQQGQPSSLDALMNLFTQLQTGAGDNASTQTANLEDVVRHFDPSRTTDAFLESQLADSELYQNLYSGKESAKSGDMESARAHFDHVRSVALSFSGPRRHYFEALAYGYEGNYSQARFAYQRCAQQELALLDRQSRAGFRTPLDDDRRRQTANRALGFFCEIQQFDVAQQWLRFLSNWPDWWRKEGQEWLSLRRIAQVEEGMGNLESALLKYEEAIRMFEGQRQRLSVDELKVAFAGDSSTRALFFDCIRTVVKLRDQPNIDHERDKELQAKVFEIAERSKARSLLDLMGGGLVGRPSSSQSSVLLRWRRLHAYRTSRCGLLEQELRLSRPDQSKISALKGEITEFERKIANAENDVSVSGQPVRSITAEVSPLRTAFQALPGDTLVLQYIFDNEHLFSWALLHQGMAKLHQKTLERYWLAREAKRFHEACKNGLQPELFGLELSRALLEPFQHLLEHYKRLIIVPHGPLHLVPFHALPFLNKEPLSSSHVVTYLPSASVLRFLTLRETEGQVQSVFALGNPSNMSFQDIDGKRRAVHALPGAELEISNIAQIMPGSKVFVGAEATFPNLRGHIHDNYSILHLATHCRLVPEVPLLSSISLANGNECSVLDLLDLRLDVDLVVLSACQTGEGLATAGDDVVGFSRALLAAGARAVLVSLWPVDDEATCDLVKYFYEGISRGQSLADALHGAQETLRSEPPRPGQSDGKESDEPQTRRRRRMAISRDVAPEEISKLPDYSLPYFWAPFILITGVETVTTA